MHKIFVSDSNEDLNELISEFIVNSFGNKVQVQTFNDSNELRASIKADKPDVCVINFRHREAMSTIATSVLEGSSKLKKCIIFTGGDADAIKKTLFEYYKYDSNLFCVLEKFSDGSSGLSAIINEIELSLGEL